ncbi:MAG TPA: nucleotidyl transferase AbiEii/AbiGii toxin family protein, partial [Desulfosporosinus sp.]|nr:nucleotidyl transferase AbiEii/AbiGii toxin family protein [Desulfosporosinus sp.]
MHEAIARMLSKYECRGLNDYINGLREILQEVALLGLWRSKFFEKAAFYGGTALRVIYGLDRFSEDIDFSLLEPLDSFDITRYTSFLENETKGFGFDVRIERIDKAIQSPVQSAFLKANTRSQLLVIETEEEILQIIPKGQVLKIKLEVDTDP